LDHTGTIDTGTVSHGLRRQDFETAWHPHIVGIKGAHNIAPTLPETSIARGVTSGADLAG
jgi:hypothetical protein